MSVNIFDIVMKLKLEKEKGVSTTQAVCSLMWENGVTLVSVLKFCIIKSIFKAIVLGLC